MSSIHTSQAFAGEHPIGPGASNSPPDSAALQRRLDQLHSAMGMASANSADEPRAAAARRPHSKDHDVLASLSARTADTPRSGFQRAWLALIPLMALVLWWTLSAHPGSAPALPSPTPVPGVRAAPGVPVADPAMGSAPTMLAAPSPAPAMAQAPNANAAAASAATTGDEEALRGRIEAWRQAWAARDVEAYLAHYSPDFKPSNAQSHAEWALARKRIISSRPDIVLSLSQIQLSRIGADHWRASFLQDYAAGGHVEKQLPKTLELRRENGQWNIVSERLDPAPSEASRP